MRRTVSIGKQDFEKVRKENCFYVDKTNFIKEWWESGDDVTLITRPRRFGKTLNMSMLNCFFSNKYVDRGELFQGLQIWEDEKYRKMQGTYPVIFFSFAGIKSNNFRDAKNDIIAVINDAYRSHNYLLKSDILSENEKEVFEGFDQYANNLDKNKEISNETVYRALNNLSAFLNRYYGKKAIILLDEYDAPMQEAYVNGYWDELVSFTRSLFNWTFKTNPYLERAIMTGITRVSKESIFSDLNNLKVITVTSDEYAKCFGFTEKEVFEALDEQGLSNEKEKVKMWYDGFTFGQSRDIYNPWSIINFLDEGKYKTYWADSSSNGMINTIVQTGSSYIKMMMEQLLKGETIDVVLDEQIVFSELDYSEDAVWSLMLASGYLKVVDSDILTGERRKACVYKLALTNLEIQLMFENMILRWFNGVKRETNEFVKALISGDVDAMNAYMNKVTMKTISYFDVGNTPSDEEPERFYHGLVLGLMVDQADHYMISSNRESGFGRYDIMLEPKGKHKEQYPGIIIEFKVINLRKEKSLEETVQNALKQIEEKDYDEELIKRGVKKENIYHYGFAFRGKEVLIDMV